MSTEDSKVISNIEVTRECWKKLKIISIDKEIHMNKLVKDILEKSVSKKVTNIDDVN